MIDVKVFLKSGQTVEFVAKEIGVARNTLGQRTRIDWVNVEGETTLCSVDLDQVAAITTKNRPAERKESQ